MLCLYDLIYLFLVTLSFSLSLRHFNITVLRVPDYMVSLPWFQPVSPRMITQQKTGIQENVNTNKNLSVVKTQLLKGSSLGIGIFYFM